MTGFLKALGDRTLALVVYGLSAVVCVVVAVLILGPELLRVPGLDVSRLPAFHATLNGSVAALLAAGFGFIRRGRIGAHRAAMVSAFALSCVFLVSYLIYHSQSPGASFGGEGWIRPVYFFVLVSHVALAPVVLPLALYTVARALRGEFDRHRSVARWTLPLWMYVAVTGVAVYLMMAPWY